MKLYDVANAPNPKVVRMFAAEKGIELPCIPVDTRNGENRKQPYLSKINAAGQVPALVLDGGHSICEVMAICEYLEELKPQPILIGSTALERAETRMWTRRIDLKYVEKMSEACIIRPGPIRKHYEKFTSLLLPIDVADIRIEIANKHLLWLNEQLDGKEFVCGDRFTLADIHLWVFLEFFEKLELSYPKSATWIDDFYKRIARRPSAKA